MKHGIHHLWLTAILLAAADVPPAGAETLYRWIDGAGRPHISDRPPPNDTTAVEQLQAPAYVQPELPADRDPYSILNQARRLEDSRQRLARERQERRQREREYELRRLELEARQAEQPPTASNPVYAYPRPVHPRRHPHHRDGQGPPARPWSLRQPDHPAYRPYPRRPAAARPIYGREGFEPPR